jgi:hypothetical protein
MMQSVTVEKHLLPPSGFQPKIVATQVDFSYYGWHNGKDGSSQQFFLHNWLWRFVYEVI